MKFNPFEEKPAKLDSTIENWSNLYPKPYNKNEVDAYTKIRIILMNGTEFEANWFSHQFSRHCDNNDIRRDLALLRRLEQQQQKKLSYLKPLDENILETTISYEQLAVDLTAWLAQNEPDPYVKATLDFALLEDFDHLYRYADLLEMEQGVKGEKLVGSYTEIMPGRPTISEHRYPFDDIKRHIISANAMPQTKLNTGIITAAEQQTMNFYMNVGTTYSSDLGRQLFMEIAMIEEQHVTAYGSLIDTNTTWLESLLMHEYTECYLYYSMWNDEIDQNIKTIWETHLRQEIAHLHYAADMLKKYEGKEWQQVIPDGNFPALIAFTPNVEKNKAYVRDVLKNTVTNTGILEEYTFVGNLPENYEFFKYNACVNKNNNTPSHNVIDTYINEMGEDYRFMDLEHPVEDLKSRTCDNTCVGREIED